MVKKQKTVSINGATCLGTQLEGSNDFRLTGCKDLSEIGNDLHHYMFEENLLFNQIPTKRNFFYSIQEYTDSSIKRELLFEELGVGELYKKGRGNFLKREFSTHFNYGNSYCFAREGIFHKFNKDNFVVVRSYIPNSFLDFFAYPFSVLCSIERNIPTPVELEENTLLGRLDNTIQSIDKDELRRIFTDEAIIDAVNNNKSSLILLSKFVELLDNDAKFFAPSISLKAIYTNKKKPPKPARGTIIFNDQAGCFEGFDGVSWRKLKWGDE